jgi:hypothetical protein
MSKFGDKVKTTHVRISDLNIDLIQTLRVVKWKMQILSNFD